MVDILGGVLSVAWTILVEGIRSIGKDDIIAVLLAFTAGAATIAIRDHAEDWTTRYINRFVRRGLRIAANYAFCLAGILFASVLAFIEFRALLPPFAQGAILGAALTATVALSVMGWQARGPSQPSARKFARIFYEPATVIVFPLIARRVTKIIDVPSIWQQIADLSSRLVG